MDFRLLGPLEARSGERAAALGGPKQRSVLAVLLLHANEVVSVDALVDQVWGEQPPANATASLHNCIFRLRKVLGPELLETRVPGYVLHASPDQIDACRFEVAVAASRELDPPGRATALSEALSHWRGPALADLTFEPFAASEIARLEELRLIALEERIEAELELGHHAELMAELEALIDRHPLRERLRHAHLLALYRSHRKPDALTAFQDARLMLIDELGLEPSESLRALERRIHIDDPSLDLPGPPRALTVVERETRRPVVVLYAEPEVAEEADPEATRRKSGTCFAAIRAAVERHGGTVQQLFGEEAVAFFGLPTVHEDDGLRALRAAVELGDELTALGAPARIALAAGDVLASIDEAPHAGASVRQARRLKDRAAPGTILLGPSVLRLVGPAVDTVPADGTGEAFRLLHLEADGPAVARRFDSPLAGREPELARLQAAFSESADRRRCGRVVVVGDPGVGKSRLAREFVRALGARAQILTGRCVAYGEAARYLPIADLVRQAAAGSGDARERITRLMAGQADAHVVAEALVPLLDDAASAPSPNVFRAVRRVLETIASRPVVVVLDDLHWAAPGLLDLVDYLAAQTVNAPILLLGLGRPELLDARPGWNRDQLLLEPLAELEARALVLTLAPGASGAQIAEILDAADGNPLFLEQLLAFRVEGEQGTPPNLETLLASRLDRLPADERDVLSRAAVAGREVWRGAAEALSANGDRQATASRLASLVRQRFLRPSSSSLVTEDAFVFQHVLIRDAAYASLPKAERSDLHERLARWLDGRPGATDEVIGFHLEQAWAYAVELGAVSDSLAREAGERLGAAGMSAWKRHDPPATVDLLSRSIELLPADDPVRLELACELGTALKASGDYRRSLEILDATVLVASATGLRRVGERAAIERIWPRLLHGQGDLDDSIRLVENTIRDLGADGDDRLLERAWFCLAALRGRFQCKHAASRDAALNALRYARLTGFSAYGCLSMLAADACYGPQPVTEALLSCADLLAEAYGDKDAEASVGLGLAVLAAMHGDFPDAREHIRDARAIFEEFGFRSGIPRDLANSTFEVETLAGDLEHAEQILRKACAVLEREGDTAWLATQTAALAELVGDAGRHAEALALSERAMKLRQRSDLPAEVAWRRARARAMANVGETAQGEVLARDALRLLEPTDELTEQARAHLALAEVLRIADREVEAAAETDAARTLLSAKGNVALLERLDS